MNAKRNIFLFIVSTLGVLSLFTSCHRATEAKTINAIVRIDKKVNPLPYNPMIFGGFIEHFHHQVYGGIFDPTSDLSDQEGFRTDVIEALKELKIPVVRWPGGCFVDGYHWLDGVGKDRKPKDDVRWGTLEPNTFGTDEFVRFCRLLDAEPYICHNGLAKVKEMTDWVEYCNLNDGKFASLRKKNGYDKTHAVKFWSVGNERSGKEYIDKVRDGAKAMKEVDSNVQVTCSGTHGAGKIDPYLFKTAGKYLDYISIHQYWIENFQKHQKPDYMSCILLSEKPDQFIEGVVSSLDQANLRGKIKLAFDEWNLRSWHHPGFPKEEKVDYKDPEIIRLINERNKSLDNSLYTMADALFSASFFNACLRHSDDVKMANVAPMVNQTGPLFVHPKGIVRRPHFYTMKMYANMLEKHIATSYIKSDSISDHQHSIPAIDALATSDKAGKKWVICLINRDPQKEKTCKVELGNHPLNGDFEASVLSGDSPDAYNDVEQPFRVIPQKQTIQFINGVTTLPPHSLSIIMAE